jgi:hypothetical protein
MEGRNSISTFREEAMSTIVVLFAPTADLAKVTIANITVEAEYGSYVWEGSAYTAAHHQAEGPYQGRHQGGDQPSPCNNDCIPALTEGIIGVSHFDLDTLGGVLRAQGLGGFFGGRLTSFWELAEFVDCNGPHRLVEAYASEQDLRYLHAFWAWSSNHRLPRAAEVTDVTEFFASAEAALRRILHEDVELLEAGQAFLAAGQKLNKDSLVQVMGGVVVRCAPSFTNHLYSLPEGAPCRAVVAYNTHHGSITVSLADPIKGVSCREIVQALWGPEAGGHDGIAGSPRGQRMSVDSLAEAAAVLSAWLGR